VIQYELADGVAELKLNHPPVNVINIALMREMIGALDEIRNSSAKVVVIGATGKLFSAGVDVADHTEDKVDEMIRLFHTVIRKIWTLPQPVVCAVQGSAIGGGMELAIACDLIISAESAKYGQPEVNVGVFPPIAALILPRLTSRQFALECVLMGENFTAQRLHELGLVNAVVPTEELEATTADYVEKLQALSGPVLQFTKRATLIGWDQSGIESPLSQIESMYLSDLMKLEDAKEGLDAFMEKRTPQWKER